MRGFGRRVNSRESCHLGVVYIYLSCPSFQLLFRFYLFQSRSTLSSHSPRPTRMCMASSFVSDLSCYESGGLLELGYEDMPIQVSIRLSLLAPGWLNRIYTYSAVLVTIPKGMKILSNTVKSFR